MSDFNCLDTWIPKVSFCSDLQGFINNWGGMDACAMSPDTCGRYPAGCKYICQFRQEGNASCKVRASAATAVCLRWSSPFTTPYAISLLRACRYVCVSIPKLLLLLFLFFGRRNFPCAWQQLFWTAMCSCAAVSGTALGQQAEP